jgi:serine protease Do
VPEDEEAISQLESLNRAFTAIARRVTPSVVTVTTKHEVEQVRWRRPPGLPDHPFFRQRRPEPEPRQRQGLGSGVVMTADGYILTNHHVAGRADQITVILSDNREFEAELVGSDSLTDVAVIKIDADGLSPAATGSSDKLQIGEWVLAVGAPMGFRATVTSGIVSAIGRNLDIIHDNWGIEDFIQTDAAINPGNSGGPLVNIRGEVVGVNTAIATPTRTYVGYSFAIPIDLASKVMGDIIAHGGVRRGFLGVSLHPVDAGTAEAVGLDKPRGVLIVEVMPGTPAEGAGVKAEDIVLEIDGQEVNRPNHVQSLIARKHPGDKVRLLVRRTDRTLEIGVKLGEREPGLTVASSPRPDPGQAEHFGLTVRGITPELAQSFGLEEDTQGVAVVDVSRGPASDAGFQPGDVIFKVRQQTMEQEIRSVKDFETALGRLKKGLHAAFSVIKRGGARAFLTIRIPE